jgi:peroxiredoxin Q/BCP
MSHLLQPGETAPTFAYVGADEKACHTRDLNSDYLVYFYPKDNTPGCKKEACQLRDAHSEYQKAGLAVVGVSFDSDASHAAFRKQHDLPFGLAADPDKAVAKAFGVYQPKKLSHRLLPFARRVSFLIDKTHIIRKTFTSVNPTEHADAVLRAHQTLVKTD